MFTAKISVNNRKAFEGLKSHLEYLCQLNGATISYDEETPGITKENKIKILYKKFNRRLKKLVIEFTSVTMEFLLLM